MSLHQLPASLGGNLIREKKEKKLHRAQGLGKKARGEGRGRGPILLAFTKMARKFPNSSQILPLAPFLKPLAQSFYPSPIPLLPRILSY